MRKKKENYSTIEQKKERKKERKKEMEKRKKWKGNDWKEKETLYNNDCKKTMIIFPIAWCLIFGTSKETWKTGNIC